MRLPSAIGFCAAALEDEFDAADDSGPKPSAASVPAANAAELKSDRNQQAYSVAKGRKPKERLAWSCRERIAALRYLPTGLARPTVPIAALPDFLQDCTIDPAHFIGTSSVRKAKDAFCSLVLTNNKAAIGGVSAFLWRRCTARPACPCGLWPRRTQTSPARKCCVS